MRIVFRTDSSLQIGSGHVMRCLTLADALRQRGAEVRFVCRELSGNLIGLIEGKGYRVARLPQPAAGSAPPAHDVAHGALLGVSWEQDGHDTVAALAGVRPDWLIVDHYALDGRWERMLRPCTGRIMVIDDLADRPHDCDLLLDQNLYGGMETRYDGLVPPGCTALLGPRYAILRPEFAAARRSLRERDGIIRRVLVFFGGMDLTNETDKALHALAGFAGRECTVDVVVGAANPHREQVREFCMAHEGFRYHCQVDNMAELMAAADLAIGGGGTTTWERCALGLPSLTIVLAENQSLATDAVTRAGATWNLGWYRDVTVASLVESIAAALSDPDCMRRMSAAGLQLVGEAGLQHLLHAIGES